MKATRSYRQADRAAAVGLTRSRIVDAAEELFLSSWYDEVGVRELASASGVATQTVVNHFGSKAGVLAAVAQSVGLRIDGVRDSVVAGDVRGAVTALMGEYEKIGDGVVRMLALEGRVKELTPLLEHGRSVHRAWVQRVFAADIDGLSSAERERRTVALIAATDVHTWKVIRREQRCSPQHTEAIVADLVDGLIRSWGQ